MNPLVESPILKLRQQSNQKWHFKWHEDLSRNRIGEFQKIYATLGLNFSSGIEKIIQENSSENSKKGEFVRNSKKNIKTWKHRLTAEEILKIRKKTAPIASEFYCDEDW